MHLRVVTPYKLISHENAKIYVKFILLSRGIYIFYRIFSFNWTYLVIFLYNRNLFGVVYPHKMFQLN